MEEIKIGKKAWILPVGLISSIAAIVIGIFFFSLADGPRIKSSVIVYAIAMFLIGVGIFAAYIAVREILAPRYLIINATGIENQTSFGQLTWDQISKISQFEGTYGSGKNLVQTSGVLIHLHNPVDFLARQSGAKRFGMAHANKKWGSPTIIISSNWAWSRNEIEEKIQSYLTAHRNKSKGKL